jgi:hypothetical protein
VKKLKHFLREIKFIFSPTRIIQKFGIYEFFPLFCLILYVANSFLYFGGILVIPSLFIALSLSLGCFIGYLLNISEVVDLSYFASGGDIIEFGASLEGIIFSLMLSVVFASIYCEKISSSVLFGHLSFWMGAMFGLLLNISKMSVGAEVMLLR